MCLAHNLVYTVVHLVPPAEPGFNTLIFGLNKRGSGFHYHQDAIAKLEAKNAPLIPHQPVVTTVFYEYPAQDQKKEVVLWKPVVNFPYTNSLYDAARAVCTTHGMMVSLVVGNHLGTKRRLLFLLDHPSASFWIFSCLHLTYNSMFKELVSNAMLNMVSSTHL